jgi:hypothetical protein
VNQLRARRPPPAVRRRVGGWPARILVIAAAALSVTLLPRRTAAQAPAPAAPAPPAPLFRGEGVLEVTLRTDLRHLLRDRDSTQAPWREATLTIAGAGGAPATTVPLRVKTRGIYRLAHCDLPPIRLRFSEKDVRGTPFDSLGRPKLTSACRNSDEYEQYVLQEYAIYLVYRLLTPISVSVRLLRVTYQDTAGSARPITRYAFVSEDPARFAERMGGTLVSDTGVGFRRLARTNIMQVSVFQYLIGNTDWAVPRLHNIALLRTDSLYAVPFDFDWSGAVDAPYAVPQRILHIRTVRERQWRGICATSDPVFAQFEALRDTIAAVYRAVPGLSPRSVEKTLRYYDEYYREAADHARFVQRVVARDCGW